ncbi:ROK family protein [Turneriella parva]|nr:ROK family protein [Turneriella parva]
MHIAPPFERDERVVLTLDAGGTKFAFSAMASGKPITEPLEFPSHGDDLSKCLKTLFAGFTEISQRVKQKPAAISFAFPGPAWYKEGIIGDLGNLPAFRGGVPLGPMLARQFGVPVFINNDGDLFTYGEALGGFLPEMNRHLVHADSTRQYKNLIGFTLGTGFGGGIARGGELHTGDNSAAGEVWLMRNPLYPQSFIEESISIRALRRVYKEHCKIGYRDDLKAKEIFQIAKGEIAGDTDAAAIAFADLGSALGDAIATAVTMIDGLVVIGGGLSNAWELFAPAMLASVRSRLQSVCAERSVPRLEVEAFDVEDKAGYDAFLKGHFKTLAVPGSDEKISFDAMKATAIGRSRLGTSAAVSLGAYMYAMRQLSG